MNAITRSDLERDRDSNMELCKIIAIILVLLVHSVFPITGHPETINDDNHLGKSTLAVLLIHTMAPFTTWRKAFFTDLWQSFSGIKLILYYALSILAIFFLCCLIDQIRLLLWKPILNYLNENVKGNEIF